jgi:hypothetical protein
MQTQKKGTPKIDYRKIIKKSVKQFYNINCFQCRGKDIAWGLNSYIDEAKFLMALPAISFSFLSK